MGKYSKSQIKKSGLPKRLNKNIQGYSQCP